MLSTVRTDENLPGVIPFRGRSLSPILQRIALAANSSLDVDEVLERLATLTLEAIPGDRCAIFLVDDHARLHARMAAGRIQNEAEFQMFLRTAPVDLRGEAERWQAFVQG